MNLHEELGRLGADGASGSAERLSSEDVHSSLGARVRSGRRRRAVGGGVGAVAGIALVAVGVWTVVPGERAPLEAAESVDTNLTDRGITYEIDGSAPVDPEVLIDLRRPNDFVCGMPLDLDEGVTVHDPDVVSSGVTIAGRSAIATHEAPTEEWLRGLDAAEVGQAWENLVGENPATVNTVDEQHVFDFQMVWDDGAGITTTTVPLLLRNGHIVTAGVSEGRAGDGQGGDAAPARMWTPNPQECEGIPLTDGVYEPLLVTQIWSDDLMDPLATVVFSAGEVDYTGLGEQLPQDSGPDVEAPADFADLPAVGSDEYLASAVSVREWAGGLSCSAILDGVGEGADPGAEVGEPGPLPPVPSWIETGRLYGWGDDVLVGGYPIPVAAVNQEWALPWGDSAQPESNEPAVLVLSAGGEYWVFDVRWLELGDPEHDGPGWFIELTPNWECGTAQLITEGVYDAQLLFGGAGDQLEVELSPISVLAGVPSLPEVDAQG